MKIVCMICPLGSAEVEENNYKIHMDTIHGGSQATGRMINQNVPPLPNGVTPADLPSPDFMATVAEIEQAKITPPPPKPPVAQPQVKSTPSITAPKQEIQLTYKYIGNCDVGHGVSTLEMDVEGKHFVVAYCLQESKQIESREVVDLKEKKIEEPNADEFYDNSNSEQLKKENEEDLKITEAIIETKKRGRPKK